MHSRAKNRQRVIDCDEVVEIGGVSFAPGDLVVADSDGVVVVPRHTERQVLQLAWQKVHSENNVRDAVRLDRTGPHGWRQVDPCRCGAQYRRTRQLSGQRIWAEALFSQAILRGDHRNIPEI
ncbi:MAG: hypothetical protein KDA99_09800 [Planctomycetales bacterium]|nr:hypothetical protein [Planctomycetales bacterium]